MGHARKMTLVDPRLLDTLRSPPPPTDTVGKKVQALDDEMKTILDRKDLDDGTKVTLYNQVLQRYNVLVDKRVKEPVRVIAVGKEAGTEPEEASSTEADVVNTVPKRLQAKARRLMEHLKRNIAWNDRGELIHEGVPVAGSNVVDLVHDLLRKRKTDDPKGWQSFARQLRVINIPMELVGNATRRAYIQQTATPTTAATRRRRQQRHRRSSSWSPIERQMEHSLPTPPPELMSWDNLIRRLYRSRNAFMSSDPQDAYRSVVASILLSGLTLLGDVAAGILIQQVLFKLWFRYVVAPPLPLWER